jgi:hypothetical protein
MSASIPPGQHVDVYEVSRCGAVEQRDDLAASELLRAERRSRERCLRRQARAGLQGDIDDQVLCTLDKQPAERVVIADPRYQPSSVLGCRDEVVMGGMDGGRT